MNQMNALYKKVAADNALQEKLVSAMKDASEEKLLAFAKEVGFDVTFADVKAFAAQAKSGELSESELDMVAGGKGDPFKIADSVLSLGISCAIDSAIYAIKRHDCGEYFNS